VGGRRIDGGSGGEESVNVDAVDPYSASDLGRGQLAISDEPVYGACGYPQDVGHLIALEMIRCFLNRI
jgi:hypothetical protein